MAFVPNMLTTGSHVKHSVTRAERATRLLPLIKQALSAPDVDYRSLGEDIGVSHTVVFNFVTKGSTPQEAVLEKMEAWAESEGARSGREGGTRNGNGSPGDAYSEQEEARQLAAIGKLPDGVMRILERESLAAVIRARAMATAERAAYERAGAIRLAEESARQRAAALSGDEEREARLAGVRASALEIRRAEQEARESGVPAPPSDARRGRDKPQ
jgi:hypothetical protein